MFCITAASCDLLSGLIGTGSNNPEDYDGSYYLQSVKYDGVTYNLGDEFEGSVLKSSTITLDIMSVYFDNADGGFKLMCGASLTNYRIYMGNWKVSGGKIKLTVATALTFNGETVNPDIVITGTLSDGILTLKTTASGFPSELVLSTSY